MKKILFVFVATLVCLSAAAAEKIDKDLAIEYLKMAKIEEVVNSTIRQSEIQMFPNAKPEEKEKFHSFMVGAMGWEAIKDQLVDLIINLYTKEEIDAVIAFMKTPAGASGAAKSEEFSKRFTTVVTGNLQKVMAQCCAANR